MAPGWHGRRRCVTLPPGKAHQASAVTSTRRRVACRQWRMGCGKWAAGRRPLAVSRWPSAVGRQRPSNQRQPAVARATSDAPGATPAAGDPCTRAAVMRNGRADAVASRRGASRPTRSRAPRMSSSPPATASILVTWPGPVKARALDGAVTGFPPGLVVGVVVVPPPAGFVVVVVDPPPAVVVVVVGGTVVVVVGGSVVVV